MKAFAENKKNVLVFSSYQGEGSLGRRIQQGEKEFSMKSNTNGQSVYQIKMEVAKIEVTGHSDRRELMNFVQRASPRPRKIIVNHGEPSRCKDLASSSHKLMRAETIAPRNLETVRLK